MNFSDRIEIVVDHVEPSGPTTAHVTHLAVRKPRSGRIKIGLPSMPSLQERPLDDLRNALCRFVADGHRVPMGDSFSLGGWQAVMLDRDVSFNEQLSRSVRARFSVIPALDGWDSRELAEIFYEDAVEILDKIEGRKP